VYRLKKNQEKLAERVMGLKNKEDTIAQLKISKDRF
jgi:hypothetical protein